MIFAVNAAIACAQAASVVALEQAFERAIAELPAEDQIRLRRQRREDQERARAEARAERELALREAQQRDVGHVAFALGVLLGVAL